MNENNEIIWKPVKDYEDLYEVSNTGLVRNKKTKKERKFTDNHGYNRVTLSKNNKLKGKLVHVLVAEAFIPNPENKTQINHKDENKRNNNVDNLEWVTPKENCNYGTRNEKLSKAFCKGGSSYDKLQKTRKEKGLGRRKVRCITTGEEFNSIKEAANKYKRHPENIRSAALGKRNYSGCLPDGTQLEWEFIEEKDNTEVND